MVDAIANHYKISPRDVEQWSLKDVVRSHASIISSNELEFYQMMLQEEQMNKK